MYRILCIVERDLNILCVWYYFRQIVDDIAEGWRIKKKNPLMMKIEKMRVVGSCEVCFMMGIRAHAQSKYAKYHVNTC